MMKPKLEKKSKKSKIHMNAGIHYIQDFKTQNTQNIPPVANGSQPIGQALESPVKEWKEGLYEQGGQNHDWKTHSDC